ncbi:MAG: TerB family tellurite resistance protein [Pseudomonadota bacterium]|nr:TerB family tellurite resistance protein [Pseudomonadota bacterium]
MLSSIKAFFDQKLADPPSSDNQIASKTQLACAALFIEVMKADYELDDREKSELVSLLQSSLNIQEEDIQELMRLAQEEADQATSLYEFTRLINDEYSYSQKVQLVQSMWQIAFSDEQIDMYEEHLIRKVSDLIYVSHTDFIKAKIIAREN